MNKSYHIVVNIPQNLLNNNTNKKWEKCNKEIFLDYKEFKKKKYRILKKWINKSNKNQKSVNQVYNCMKNNC
jgi:hypothetical protein